MKGSQNFINYYYHSFFLIQFFNKLTFSVSSAKTVGFSCKSNSKFDKKIAIDKQIYPHNRKNQPQGPVPIIANLVILLGEGPKLSYFIGVRVKVRIVGASPFYIG